MKHHIFVVFALLASSFPGTGSTPGLQAPPIRVLSSNGVRAVLVELEADMEQTIGRPLDMEFSTASSLARSIEEGRPFDVAILTPTLIADLIAQGRVVAESRVVFARVGVGVGARADTGAKDVSTATTLRDTLLAAESVAFTAEGQSRATIDGAFAELGIVEAMQAKTILLGPGEAPDAVAAGEAELVLTLVSEILPAPGLDLVGPLPAELQNYISFAAGRSSAANDARAADALLMYLAGPAVAAALARQGMEPILR